MYDFELERNEIILELSDGSSLVCDVLAIFEANQQEYIVLFPKKEVQDGEVLIYRYSESEEGDPVLADIESDEEFEIAAEAFDELQDEWEYDGLDFEDPYKDEFFGEED